MQQKDVEVAMKLTGQQYQLLTRILLDAFLSQARLAQMVRFRLDKNLNAIALGDDLQEIIFKLIGTAEAEGWTAQLITAARESNPGNPDLFAFAQQFGLAPITPSRPKLEKIIRATNSFLDINAWRERLGKIEAQVCRIEIASNLGTIFGTGFLLGPSVVMTNYHVVEAVILGEQGLTTSKGVGAMPNDVTLRFDYKRLADGTTLNHGIEYRLAAQDWLIDKSSYVAEDRIPQPDELDYVLLKIDGSPGYEPIGRKAEPEAPLRGWIETPTEAHDFLIGTPLFIVQHPKAEPLKLGIDTDAVIGLNENGTTVTYKTNTLPGSSGSPCFNSNWELVALHHSGDPDFSNPTYNAGTPFKAILTLLEKRGVRNILGEQQL
ncbi:MAG: effector-associated domain EAD1-containing protein [Coleofasciculaceae cyanobacterium]